ncbi:MAG: hypothetical protein HC942_21255 [Microcoleus sp. SU_5_6]|nr:hypothetical protein [Microcoleus sp. SU_5_6]
MRVYQFRQFRINHDLPICRMFADLSSVLRNLIFKAFQIRQLSLFKR